MMITLEVKEHRLLEERVVMVQVEEPGVTSQGSGWTCCDK